MFPSIAAGVAYSASKIGMEALNAVTNEEGNAHGVRACLFNPGAGNTPIIDRRPVKFSQEQKMKMIQPEDIAATLWFSSRACRRASTLTWYPCCQPRVDRGAR